MRIAKRVDDLGHPIVALMPGGADLSRIGTEGWTGCFRATRTALLGRLHVGVTPSKNGGRASASCPSLSRETT